MIVAGFGFTSKATVASLQDALRQTATLARPDLLATAASKVDAPALRALAAELRLPVVTAEVDEMAAQATPTQSMRSRVAHGTGSVAEAAALAAAGPDANLLGARVVSADRQATCALARSADKEPMS